MNPIVFAIVVVVVLGLAGGVILVLASKFMAVYEDPRIAQITECLAGANCGGCGYPGCAGCAEAILAGKAPVTACAPAGAEGAAKIAAIMGMEAPSGEKMVAHVLCNGGCNAKDKANYEGLQDCHAAMRVASGPKACSFGCMGLGSCVKACAFDAIHIVDGVAKVDTDKCVACGKCVSTCPKKIINLVSEVKKVHVNCVNKDKGPAVMKVCSNGCILGRT